MSAGRAGGSGGRPETPPAEGGAVCVDAAIVSTTNPYHCSLGNTYSLSAGRFGGDRRWPYGGARARHRSKLCFSAIQPYQKVIIHRHRWLVATAASCWSGANAAPAIPPTCSFHTWRRSTNCRPRLQAVTRYSTFCPAAERPHVKKSAAWIRLFPRG